MLGDDINLPTNIEQSFTVPAGSKITSVSYGGGTVAVDADATQASIEAALLAHFGIDDVVVTAGDTAGSWVVQILNAITDSDGNYSLLSFDLVDSSAAVSTQTAISSTVTDHVVFPANDRQVMSIPANAFAAEFSYNGQTVDLSLDLAAYSFVNGAGETVQVSLAEATAAAIEAALLTHPDINAVKATWGTEPGE